MYQLDKFKVKKTEDTDTLAKIEIGPLPKGFGATVGNAIRRILLTTISGSAITSVKISGIKHEYSTIKGMQQDVITLLLNLKNVSLKSHSEEPVILKLNKKGDKKGVVTITAGDFEKNPDIEIFNEDLVLAELTDEKAKLELEVTVENGIGYSMPDERKRAEIGVIPIDSIFSPVKHVNYEIVKSRFGQQTDLDQINLDIYTDGSSKPSEVFLEALEIFDLVANRLVDLAGGDSFNNSLEAEIEEEEEDEPKQILISDLTISTRLANSLRNSGISDLYELEGKSRNEILSFKGMGKKSFEELIDILENSGINIIS